VLHLCAIRVFAVRQCGSALPHAPLTAPVVHECAAAATEAFLKQLAESAQEEMTGGTVLSTAHMYVEVRRALSVSCVPCE
jgi:hypothetical protein